MDPLVFRLAGATFHNPDLVGSLPIGSPLALRPQPDNRYDPNAIEILVDAERIGYVPKTKTAAVRALLGSDLSATYTLLVEESDWHNNHPYAVVRLSKI
jgi:hypothetical protein